MEKISILHRKRSSFWNLCRKEFKTTGTYSRLGNAFVADCEGKLSRKDFMKDIDKYTDQVVSEIKAGVGTFRHDNLTNSKCPRCGKENACGERKEQ